ncbi:MBL fold metallo-hydrolase [Acidiferrimicrobium sp. IK]|uniref:MBL fold metallo-hydrolase n=1 Tax=Acidiferrimicrobium sp. IK TaxID=2871700 RepID=UPI0021CB881A|nr:MBL fold metallo-hydrolase [Acidiferrimicrobium sp. IK]MCU4187468.1 MBL fold metallo-hydrolase [Acidiferrimicrobium sp. IK]
MSARPAPGGDDWTEPGIFEVAPGVHRIPLPLPNDGLRAVNVYAVVGPDSLELIDSGWAIPGAQEVLSEALGDLGASLGDIRRFLVTHAHRDHYTQAVELRRHHGSRIALGAGERPTLEEVNRPGRKPLEPQFRQLRRYGAAGLAAALAGGIAEHAGGTEEPGGEGRSNWEDPDDWLEEGPLTLGDGRVVEVVETPGHTRGHVVFHDREGGLLFAGDHVLPAITPSIGFEAVLSPNPLGDFLGSLALVRGLPDATLLAAHGPVAPSVHTRIDELVQHHGRRLEQTLAAVGRGADTALEVAGQLLWTRRQRKLGDLDAFNQMLAVAETGAHLELLVSQSRVCRTLDDGVYRYWEGAA